jgi:hypothetical protein
VIGFLQKAITKGGEAELGHKPQSEDMVPFFQKYAWTLVKVRLERCLMSFSTEDELLRLIEEFIPRVVAEICSKGTIEEGSITGGGVWWRTVDSACNAVNLGVRHGLFGTYDRFAFLRPSRVQLKELLLADAHELMTDFWLRRANQDEFATAGDRKGAIADGVEFPNRAAWIRQRLDERDWSQSEIATYKGGPDRKTIRRILNGEPVSTGTLQKVAIALSKHSGLPKVLVSDIPQN